MVAGAAVETKKRKRSHADKRAKKKQEVSLGEAKAVEETPVEKVEEVQAEQGLLLFFC